MSDLTAKLFLLLSQVVNEIHIHSVCNNQEWGKRGVRETVWISNVPQKALLLLTPAQDTEEMCTLLKSSINVDVVRKHANRANENIVQNKFPSTFDSLLPQQFCSWEATRLMSPYRDRPYMQKQTDMQVSFVYGNSLLICIVFLFVCCWVLFCFVFS